MNIPTQQYVDDRGAELLAAVETSDGDAAVTVLKRIARDGYPEYADELTNRLAAQGLRNLAEAAR